MASLYGVRALFGVTALGALTACASTAAQQSTPAVLDRPTAEVRAALLHAVTDALSGQQPTLAEDALTISSYLSIEPARPRDREGRLMQGRETRPVEVFRLFQQGHECVLVHERTKRQFVLPQAKCSPAKE